MSDNRTVRLTLIVDPSSSAEQPQKTVGVMLWSGNSDPTLLDAKFFTSGAAFRAWLKEVAGKYGSENIAVKWTKKLKADNTVSRLVAACLDISVPD